jgi:hypothetical protein
LKAQIYESHFLFQIKPAFFRDNYPKYRARGKPFSPFSSFFGSKHGSRADTQVCPYGMYDGIMARVGADLRVCPR